MSDVSPYALPAEMTIPFAAETREALLQAIGVGQTQFAADAVESIDSSGIQLLLALHRSLQTNGVSLAVTQPSVPLMDALRLYGLGDVLVSQP